RQGQQSHKPPAPQQCRLTIVSLITFHHRSPSRLLIISLTRVFTPYSEAISGTHEHYSRQRLVHQRTVGRIPCQARHLPPRQERQRRRPLVIHRQPCRELLESRPQVISLKPRPGGLLRRHAEVTP